MDDKTSLPWPRGKKYFQTIHRRTDSRVDVRAVTSPTTSSKSGRPSKAKKADTKPPEGTETKREGGERYSITITVPPPDRLASGAMNAALLPVALARRILPAKHGLPLYAGLGLLGATDVIEWPVVVGIGVGYAVLRGSGVLAPPATAAKTEGAA
jgi:hypothetical protein